MSITQILEKINKIALDASLADLTSGDDLETLFNQLLCLSQEVSNIGFDSYKNILELGKQKILDIHKEDAKERQKVLAFIFDYVQNTIKHLSDDKKTECSIECFESELFNLLGITSSNQFCVQQLQSNPTLVSEFIQSATSYIDEIEESILYLERNGFHEDNVNIIFRALHTIKSEANLLCLVNFGNLSHKTEDLFDNIKIKNLILDNKIISYLLNLIDTFRNFLQILPSNFQKSVNIAFSEEIKTIDGFLGTIAPDNNKNNRKKLMSKNNNEINNKGNDAPIKNDGDRLKDEGKVKIVGAGDKTFTPSIPVLDLSEGVKMFTEFFSECYDHLTNSEDAVLVLENNPDDMDSIDVIFRSFHTIKGLAGFLSWHDIKTLAHTTETMFDLVRQNILKCNMKVTDVTLHTIDVMRKLFSLLQEQVANNGILISEYIDISDDIELINNIINQEFTQEEKKEKPIGEIMLEEGDITPEELIMALERQAISGGTEKIGEILQNTNAASKKDVSKALNIQAGKIENSIKIGIDKLDTLIDLVGELVISETQVIQDPLISSIDSKRFIANLSELDRITRLLQESTMNMRLIPVKSTFQKMVRIVRDLSKKAGKDINVKLRGEDTEIDKNMVELIGDPLMHMVRNSADHGVEMPERRKQKGKTKAGTIILSAYHKGGYIGIDIQDDGAGLNKEKILEKAMSSGIIKSRENLPDKRIWNLIFEPGFSTADKVTDISGRGVGMDVVKKNIEKLRGKIEITSEEDKGSCFSIFIPITLAIIEGIILRIGTQRFIIPISSIIEFVTPDKKKVTNIVSGGELYKFYDEVLSLIPLGQLFKIKSDCKSMEEKTICVIDSQHGQFCLLVDEVLGQQQVVIKSLGRKIGDIKGVSGGAILGDGRIGLMLDANGIVEYFKESFAIET